MFRGQHLINGAGVLGGQRIVKVGGIGMKNAEAHEGGFETVEPARDLGSAVNSVKHGNHAALGGPGGREVTLGDVPHDFGDIASVEDGAAKHDAVVAGREVVHAEKFVAEEEGEIVTQGTSLEEDSAAHRIAGTVLDEAQIGMGQDVVQDFVGDGNERSAAAFVVADGNGALVENVEVVAAQGGRGDIHGEIGLGHDDHVNGAEGGDLLEDAGGGIVGDLDGELEPAGRLATYGFDEGELLPVGHPRAFATGAGEEEALDAEADVASHHAGNALAIDLAAGGERRGSGGPNLADGGGGGIHGKNQEGRRSLNQRITETASSMHQKATKTVPSDRSFAAGRPKRRVLICCVAEAESCVRP